MSVVSTVPGTVASSQPLMEKPGAETFSPAALTFSMAWHFQPVFSSYSLFSAGLFWAWSQGEAANNRAVSKGYFLIMDVKLQVDLFSTKDNRKFDLPMYFATLKGIIRDDRRLWWVLSISLLVQVVISWTA